MQRRHRRVVCRPRASRSAAPGRWPPARAGCTVCTGRNSNGRSISSQRRSFSGSFVHFRPAAAWQGLQFFGRRHLRRRRLVFEALLRLLERRRADEDLLAILDRHHAPRREAAAVTAAIDAVDDGLGEIAAPQEVRVHRMHDASVVDGANAPPSVPGRAPGRRTPAGCLCRGSGRETGLPRDVRARIAAGGRRDASITELERALHHASSGPGRCRRSCTPRPS